jgi:hypothetical protein
MEKLGLLDRFLLGRTFTVAMNLGTLALVALITFGEIWDWTALPSPPSARTPTVEGGELHGTLMRQGAIGVVLVALGVVLEGRRTFLHRVMRVYHLEHLPGQEEFTDTCELFGFYILVLGLLVECFGEFVKFCDTHHWLAKHFFCGMSIALNLTAMVFLLRLSLRVFRLRLVEN